MTFTRVDVESDTPEWEQERRASVGASEVAAVMGLSPYNTALDVFKHKHGIDRDFDPLLSFVGHASEPIMHEWVERYSGVDVKLEPAFMARSERWPFLHVSFDRVSSDPFTTWQFKTAHFYAGHHWDEGIPTDIRIQVDRPRWLWRARSGPLSWCGSVAASSGCSGEPRDDRFINENMIPALTTFWDGVQSGNPPAPATIAENAERFPTTPGKEVEASRRRWRPWSGVRCCCLTFRRRRPKRMLCSW